MQPEKHEILIICGSNSWGGLEIMALNSAILLKKYGFKINFFCPFDSELFSQANKNDIETTGFKNGIGKFQAIRKLKNMLKGKKITIVHTHLSHDLWTVVPAMKMASSDALLFLTKHLASGIKKKDIFHKYLYGRVNKIFVISDFIKRNVIETCPVPEDRVILLHNGIDLKIYDKTRYNRNEIRNELGIEKNKFVIGLVGRITPGKGHFEFINAAEIINRTYSQKTVFLVTGSAVKGEENIEHDIKNLANEKSITNIIFTGYRRDIAKIMTGIDLLAFPSHEESFGITLLEAMAMEVTVVASNCAGVTDIIPSDEFGVLILPKNHASLAGGIIKLIEDAGLRKRLAENGRKRVEQIFDIEKLTKELIKYYNIESQENKNGT
jgi:glycosyltransferase involved in cell wall biosynthesis